MLSASAPEEMFSGTVLMTHRGQKLSGPGSDRGWKAQLEHSQAHPYFRAGAAAVHVCETFSWVLSISMDGDYKTSPGNLLQFLITFTIEKLLLIFR